MMDEIAKQIAAEKDKFLRECDFCSYGERKEGAD